MTLRDDATATKFISENVDARISNIEIECQCARYILSVLVVSKKSNHYHHRSDYSDGQVEHTENAEELLFIYHILL